MSRKIVRISLATTVVLLMSACGGGGGGGQKSYAGTWRLRTTKVVDECGLGAASSLNNDILVNQDGNRIVVNSGTLTLAGETTDDDGFLAVSPEYVDGRCTSAAAISFSNAGDGEAAVGVAFGVTCGGSRLCRVAFGGTGSKLTGRSTRSVPQDIQLTLKDVISAAEKNIGSLIETEQSLTATDLAVSQADEVSHQ